MFLPKRKYTPVEVANTFLARHGNERSDLTHMKLQKLAYLTHGFWLRDHDEPIVSSEPEVWQYGPVFAQLYRHLRNFRNQPISAPVPDAFDESISLIRDEEVLNVIDAVWGKYGHRSGAQLSDLTHRPGSPWYEMARANEFMVPKGLKIPTELVRDYYRSEVPPLAG